MPTDLLVLQALASCTSTVELAATVDRLTRALGMRYWIYMADPPMATGPCMPFVLGNAPPEWLARYRDANRLRRDPIAAQCRIRGTPVCWAGADAVPTTAAEQRKLDAAFGEARQLGLESGVSIPLHGPGPGWGMMTFANGASFAGALPRHVPQLHLLAHFVHEGSRRFVTATPSPRAPLLTPRERECLFWAAQGKTSWEIGQLLVIAERTVVFHLQNAAQKFGVSGRQAAIACAVARGLVAAPHAPELELAV